MLYMFLLYGSPEAEWPSDIIEQHLEFYRSASARGAYVTSEALGGDLGKAVSVRVRRGKAVETDGPFAESKEVLGGFYILDCASPAEARKYAAEIPDAKYGTVVIRPVMAVPQWPYADAERHARHPMG